MATLTFMGIKFDVVSDHNEMIRTANDSLNQQGTEFSEIGITGDDDVQYKMFYCYSNTDMDIHVNLAYSI